MPPNDVINDLTVTRSCVHLSPPYIRYILCSLYYTFHINKDSGCIIKCK